jgi:predicted permease
MPYVASMTQGATSVAFMNVAFVMILVVVCSNLAALTYARTAARVGEITVRTALGATRGRILAQLFTEALVLVALAAVVGLVIVGFGMRRGMEIAFSTGGGMRPPFWWDGGIASSTILYVGALAILAALLIGVPPALRVTGRGIQASLQRLGVGSPGMRFGGVWTFVIILQVAISVVFIPEAIFEGREMLGNGTRTAAFPADQYLSARIVMDSEPPLGSGEAQQEARYRAQHEELERRLSSEPGAARVTIASQLPGAESPGVFVEVERRAATEPGDSTGRVHTAAVDAGFFDAFDLSILAGHSFAPGDFQSSHDLVIVNRSFAQRFFGGASPIGRRFRTVDRAGGEPNPWLEIIGVAADMAVSTDGTANTAAFYRPLIPGEANPMYVAIRVRGNPMTFAPRLRAIALATDPSLRLYDVRPLNTIAEAEQRAQGVLTLIAAFVALAALLLSAAGVYSLVSFTVAQRTREIGIRAALGAQPRRIVVAIFSRAVAQLGMGVVAGGLLAALVGDQTRAEGPAVLLGVAALMMVVGLLACVIPARRALRVQPTEALRADG